MSTENYQLDFNDFSNGIYFIEIINQKEKSTFKIVISK
ncbi:MAG: T9SS type A sorting domain-containing protein [Flavobacteriia bacterium]|nr:T9SS type A sorting domain-containing protein [Flavobacteriia bacterium]